jgi:sporulation protein YlmC with PRC-barrel domain
VTLLVKATDLIGRPVVTLGGDDVGEVKDVVLALADRGLRGFTLRGRGFLAGPLPESLPWASVHAVGRDAVMVADVASLDHGELRATGDDADAVLAVEVLADDGSHLGTLTDVVLSLGVEPELVGFELALASPDPGQGPNAFLPVDEMMAISGRALVVPAAARDFLHDDLSGFGAGVDAYRAQLGGAAASRTGGGEGAR